MKYLFLFVTGIILVTNPACDDLCPCGYTKEPVFEFENHTRYPVQLILLEHEKSVEINISPYGTHAVPVDMSLSNMTYLVRINDTEAKLRIRYTLQADECDAQPLLRYRSFSFVESNIPFREVHAGEGIYCYNHWAMPELPFSRLNQCRNDNEPTPPLFALGWK